VLAVAAPGLFVYRIHYKPPVLALLRTTARSQLVQSILSPIVHAMEKDLQRTMTLIKSNPDSPPDKVRPGQAATTDDLWKASEDQGSNPENGQQDSQEANAGDQMQDSLPLACKARREKRTIGLGTAGRRRFSITAKQQWHRPHGGDTQQQSETQILKQAASPLEVLMQALKSMAVKLAEPGREQPGDSEAANSQGMPQSGNSRQPGSGEADKKVIHGAASTRNRRPRKIAVRAGSQQGSRTEKNQRRCP